MTIRVITLALALCLSAFGQFGNSATAKTAPVSKTVSIPISTSIMAAGVDLQGCTPAAIEMPSAWDTGNLTFSVASTLSGTYKNVYDEFGTEVTVTAAASRFIRLSPADWWSMRYLKIRSGTSGTPVTQTAARTLTIHCR